MLSSLRLGLIYLGVLMRQFFFFFFFFFESDISAAADSSSIGGVIRAGSENGALYLGSFDAVILFVV